MQFQISKNTFENLKREATRLKRSSGITHSEALDQLAIQHGFANWSLLAKHISDNPGINKPNRVILHSVVWPNPNDGIPPLQLTEIPTVHPPRYYSKMKWMPQDWSIRRRSRDSLQEGIRTISRALRFMDATSLKPSSAWVSIFRRVQTEGFDHTCMWRDEQNQFIVTTEPYHGFTEKIEKLIGWCRAQGWDFAQLPKNIGIWNPCLDTCTKDCEKHTSLFVMSPIKNGGNVPQVVRALLSQF